MIRSSGTRSWAGPSSTTIWASPPRRCWIWTGPSSSTTRSPSLSRSEARSICGRGCWRRPNGDYGFALDADPDEEESRLNLARIAALQGRRTQARELLQRLVDSGEDPDFVGPGLLLRSQLALDLKDTAQASADARRVIELWPDKPWGHLQLAACHIKAMNAGEAISALKEAEDRVENPRDVPDIYALRTSAYQQLEKADKARREYEKVEGMARLPQVVFGDILNPAANIPINPNKPIDVRRILSDLFGEAARAPQGYEALLRNIVDQPPRDHQATPRCGSAQHRASRRAGHGLPGPLVGHPGQPALRPPRSRRPRPEAALCCAPSATSIHHDRKYSNHGTTRVLHSSKTLIVSLFLDGDSDEAHLEIKSTKHGPDLSRTDDVIVVLDGAAVPLTEQDHKLARVDLSPASRLIGRPLHLHVRVHEFFEAWELEL